MIDDDGVQNADAADQIRSLADGVLERRVLEIPVLDADQPSLIEAVRCVIRILKYVGGDPDLPVVTRGHAEIQVGAFDGEIVGTLAAKTRLGRGVGSKAVVAKDDSGEIQRRRHRRLSAGLL
jgi:hypothetical protein